MIVQIHNQTAIHNGVEYPAPGIWDGEWDCELEMVYSPVAPYEIFVLKGGGEEKQLKKTTNEFESLYTEWLNKDYDIFNLYEAMKEAYELGIEAQSTRIAELEGVLREWISVKNQPIPQGKVINIVVNGNETSAIFDEDIFGCLCFTTLDNNQWDLGDENYDASRTGCHYHLHPPSSKH